MKKNTKIGNIKGKKVCGERGEIPKLSNPQSARTKFGVIQCNGERGGYAKGGGRDS